MSELKRCPFCGGEATMQAPNMHRKTCITCKKCGMSTKFGAPEQAIAAWNRRTPDIGNPVTENEALDEAYDLGYQSCLHNKGLNWKDAEALQRHLSVCRTSKPLTLEELQGMDGEPVLVDFVDDDGEKHVGWYAVNVVSDNITLVSVAGEKVYLYVMVKGKDRMYQVSTYRRKPESKEEAE